MNDEQRLLRALKGKRVRVHRNLHNGLFAISYQGRVQGYASNLRLKNVLPKVSEAGWRRCNRDQTRNVHAYLQGELVSFAGEPSTRGWRAITYRCKTASPSFYFKGGQGPFAGAAEVSLSTLPGKKVGVWARGKPQAPNPSSDCGCKCGPVCTCGKLQSWWRGGPPRAFAPQRNPRGEPRFFFNTVEENLERIMGSEPFFVHADENEEEERALGYGVLDGGVVDWSFPGFYTIWVDVERITFMEGNLWNHEHARGLVERARRGDTIWRPPAARVYRIEADDVEWTRKYEEEGELEYQTNMVRPWSQEDVGEVHVTLLDGNHRAAAAILLGARRIPVYVSENYREDIRPDEWIHPRSGRANPTGTPSRGASDWEAKVMRIDYESGKSLREIGKRHGVSEREAREAVLWAGATLRGPGLRGGRAPLPMDPLRAESEKIDYQHGASLAEIGKRYGVSREQAKLEIVAAGGSLRTASGGRDDMDAVEEAALVRDCRVKGMSRSALSSKYGVSLAEVNRIVSMKKINLCGAVLAPAAMRLHTTRSGALLLLDLANLNAYDRAVVKEHGFCPLIAAFRYGPLEVKRSFVTHDWARHRKLPRASIVALAKRLGTSVVKLENTLELEGTAWHDASRQPNPASHYLGQGADRGYAPDPPDERCADYRQGDWASGRGLVDHEDIMASGGGDSCEVEIAEYLSRKGHSHVTEIKSETRCGETMVRKALRNLQSKGFAELASKDYFADRGLPYRANRKHYRLTERGDQWQCAMRFGYHATRAAESIDAMSDEAMARESEAASARDAVRAAEKARLAAELREWTAKKTSTATSLPAPMPAYVVLPPTNYGRYVSIDAKAPNGEWAGRIRLLNGVGDDRSYEGLGQSAAIMDLAVAPDHSGSEVPRVLYQAASDYAQQQFGLPLSSAVHRGMSQDTFWNRQIKAGTAKRHDYRSGEFLASRFALDYPPPARLPNPRKKVPSTLYLVRATCAIPGYTASSRSHYLTRLNDRTGQFAFTVYRDAADRFQGLDVTEVAIQWVERALQRSTGRRYVLEVQPLSGGHAIARGCPAPL